MITTSESRRKFLRHSAALAGGALAAPAFAADEEKPAAAESPKSETLVKTLYDSFNDEQREALCMPFDHELRSAIDNNWHITKQRIGKFLDRDQNAMVREIFDNLHSEEYRGEVMRQVGGDNGGGFGSSSIAIFGEPGSGKFEFVLTGRHTTRRADGDSVEGKAFGGPIFYGHAAQSFNEEPHHPGNVYWFQAKRANEVYQMLDADQRAEALRPKSRGERREQTVKFKGVAGEFEGLRFSDMSGGQQEGVKKVLDDMLMPFRKEDREESMRLIEEAGLGDLHLAFFKDRDIGDDGVWDNWLIEGPHMVWYFRGAPHVHAWIHIRDPKTDVV